MRVRRASDNNEADIGFDSNSELSLTSPVSNPSSGGPFTDFADFIGHGGTPTNGFVRTWYDQSQAGGTGSGVGTYITQCVRDEFPHASLLNQVNCCGPMSQLLTKSTWICDPKFIFVEAFNMYSQVMQRVMTVKTRFTIFLVWCIKRIYFVISLIVGKTSLVSLILVTLSSWSSWVSVKNVFK